MAIKVHIPFQHLGPSPITAAAVAWNDVWRFPPLAIMFIVHRCFTFTISTGHIKCSRVVQESWVPIGSLFTFQHRLPGTPTWPTLEHLKCPVDIVNVEQWWTINVIARGGNLYTSFHTTAAAVIGLGPKCWNGMWTFMPLNTGPS